MMADLFIDQQEKQKKNRTAWEENECVIYRHLFSFFSRNWHSKSRDF